MSLEIINYLKDIISRIDGLYDKVQEPYSSAQINELSAALAKAQGEYRTVYTNRINPHFKNEYADINAILSTILPTLSKNGLSFVQQIRLSEEGNTILHSILTHSSGQWMESRVRIVPVKNDMQSFGSALKYLRRYTAEALLGITISDDPEDDDAEVNVAPTRVTYVKPSPLAKVEQAESPMNYETITKEQREQLEYELEDFKDIAEQVLNGLKIQSLADMPKAKFQASLTRIRSIKNARSGDKY